MLSKNVISRLRKIVGKKNVLTSEEDRLVHSYDATALLCQIPDAVVSVDHTEQIIDLIKLAADANYKIVPRGSATGLSGGAIPVENCIVLSTLKLNRLLEIDLENLTAMVEPGVITADLHRAVEAEGLFYPPDPGSIQICTIGGNVAENSGGLRGLKYGVTKDYVMGLDVVLPSGELLSTGGKNTKDVAGYNLKQLFVGSEGTLGIFTKILLKLIPKPAHKKTLIAYFGEMKAAAATVAAIIAAPVIPTTLEFLDRITIGCVEAHAHIGLPLDMEAILLMESDGHPVAVEDETAIMARLAREHGALEVRVAKTQEEAAQMMEARRMAFPALARMRPTTVLEDISVPRSKLVEMVECIHLIAQKYDLTIGTFGHAGDGNLHPTILLDERNKDELIRMKKGFEAILEKAIDLGGTITGEHGVGLLKKDYLPKLIQTPGMETMRRFRQIMDPQEILNPGKMFTQRPRCEGQLP